jgi:hypothetical protein
MKTIAFEYKCRRCGKINRNPKTAEKNGLAVITAAVLDAPMPMLGFPVRLVDSHFCPDGGMGVTDLIGYSVEE